MIYLVFNEGYTDAHPSSERASLCTEAIRLARRTTDRPAELTATAKLQIINGVQWLQAVPAGAPAPDGGSYWTAVDHRPYVTLWVPDGAGTSAVQATSDAIREHLQAASLDLGR